jgi:hypothetical protein
LPFSLPNFALLLERTKTFVRYEIMKMIKLILVAVILSGIGSGVVEHFCYLNYLQASPPDHGELLRQRTDKIMTSRYGSDWSKILVACERTNRVQLKIMVEQYESAIGYHRPEHQAAWVATVPAEQATGQFTNETASHR